jgi:predicted HAD superfamily phosphohydrolase
VFALLSKYDDYLAYVEKKPGYNAGTTLCLVLPFLKAFDVSDTMMEEYSRQHIRLVPGADQTLRQIRQWMPVYIVSTSYEAYIKALCPVIGVPGDVACSTQVHLDDYELTGVERAHLRRAAAEIAGMPMIEWVEEPGGDCRLSSASGAVVARLNELFWDELMHMRVGRILHEVRPVGGAGKAEAVQAILRTNQAEIGEVLYVGDSITDLKVLTLVRRGGGLAVAFNGNVYAIQGAQVAACSERTTVIEAIAAV